MTCYYAQPYDIAATGFYFADMDEYTAKRKACRNAFSDPVEEFEIQFIDGERLDAKLFEALGISQANIASFIDKNDEWEEWEKHTLILAVGECGYRFDIESGDPSDFDVDLYEVRDLRELAEQFVEEGLYGDIPDSLQFYIDYDAIARDLGVEYSEVCIAGTYFVYRCL